MAAGVMGMESKGNVFCFGYFECFKLHSTGLITKLFVYSFVANKRENLCWNSLEPINKKTTFTKKGEENHAYETNRLVIRML